MTVGNTKGICFVRGQHRRKDSANYLCMIYVLDFECGLLRNKKMHVAKAYKKPNSSKSYIRHFKKY